MSSKKTTTTHLTVDDVRYLINPNADSCFATTLFGGTPDHKTKSMWFTSASRQQFPTLAKRYYQTFCKPGEVVADGFDISAPDDSVVTINSWRHCGGIPKLGINPSCRIHAYEIAGKCDCLDDIKSSNWDYVLIYEGLRPNGPQTFTDGTNEVASDPLIDTQPYVADQVYFAGKITWRQITETNIPNLATQPTRGDLFYGEASCSHGSGCGCDQSSMIGIEWQAKLTSLLDDASSLHYSTDTGLNWTTITLPNVGNDRTYTKLDRVGNYILILYQSSVPASNGYILYPILSDGTLGTASDFVGVFPTATLEGMRDFCELDDGSIIFLDGGGKVFIVNDVTVGNAQEVDLSSLTTARTDRIACCGSTVVIVGFDDGGGAPAQGVLYSINYGQSWTAATNPAGWGGGGFGLTSVWMHSTTKWDVGTDDGQVFRTCDQGLTWILFKSDFSSAVTDIVFGTNLAGYYATLDDIYWTLDGGTEICASNMGPRLQSGQYQTSVELSGTSNRGPRIAVPCTGNADFDANYILVGGAISQTEGWNMYGSPVLV